MADIDELFAACDVNGDDAVSKFEFLEFLRDHKPKHGPWQSVAKLQSHFGLDKKTDVTKESFRAAFANAAEKGLDPRDFEFRFAGAAAVGGAGAGAAFTSGVKARLAGGMGMGVPTMGGKPPPLSMRIFKKYDTDDDGFIDLAELTSMMYDLGHPLDDQGSEHALETLDTHRNGKIEYDDFKEWWNRSDRYEMLILVDDAADENYSAWMQHTIAHFKVFDPEHTGNLRHDDFAQLHANLISHGYPIDGDVEAALATLDGDNDGMVSLKEYVRWLTALKYGEGFFKQKRGTVF